MQACRVPNTCALEWGATAISYAGMVARVHSASLLLSSCGVLSDSMVALLLHRSLELAVGVMGVLFANGAFVPCDPSWPLERRQYIIADVNSNHLLIQAVHSAEVQSWYAGSLHAFGNDGQKMQSEDNLHRTVPAANLRVSSTTLQYVIHCVHLTTGQRQMLKLFFLADSDIRVPPARH